MPNDDYNARDRDHVAINALRETRKFKVPTSPQSRKALREDYAAHANLLLDQLAAIFAANAPTPNAQRLRIETLKPGTLVAVETKPPTSTRAKTQKVPQGLEFPNEEIVILRSERAADRTERALLFVPDEAQAFLRGRLTEYGRDPGNRNRPHLDRFEAVERFADVAPQQLFVGRVNLNTHEPSWWELWVSGPRARADSLAGQARASRLDVHDHRLVFPDTTVLFVHAEPPALLRFVGQLPGAIAEIRAASGTIQPFLERREGRVGQHDYTAELAARLRAPPADAPAVCVLDTGVSAAHPLLQPGLRGAWAYDDAWGSDDHHGEGGHGTPLTGLVLHGDLDPLMNGAGSVAMTHNAESMKLLPPPGIRQTEPDAWGIVTQGAVALTETERPGILRSFCLASSSPLFPPVEPSSWSGALDQIAAGAMPGEGPNVDEDVAPPRRLMLVATGNRNGGQRVDVEPLQPLEDPSQSWNTLSIGGFTRKAQPAAGMTPVVPANHRSPYSLGSHTLPYELTPIKPEVLFEAGNMLADRTDFCGWHEAVSLLAPGSDVAQEPLVPFYATSAAVGMAGHFAGRLQAALPALWPETHRALTVDSAAWTEPMLARVISRGAHWKGGRQGTSAQRQAFLREFGYGVPDLERAIRSARNDVTLLAEAEIQPFTTGADRRGVFNEMHFYRLPWPRVALQDLGDEVVTMKVTLSYFIEPNLTGRAATRPDTYRSFGLRFAMKKRSESEAHFRGRINADQVRDPTPVETESSRWLLGPKAIQAGSLHCDVWRGRAVELAGHDGIAVFPVSGWWKSHIGQRRMESKARYALSISISASGVPVDLHAEVVTEIVARTRVEVEVPVI